MKPNQFEDGQSVQALDQNAKTLAQQGYGVVSGCEVQVLNGDLGTGNAAVEVLDGQVLDAGTPTNVAQTPVDIASSNAQPRKDLVVYDTSDGSLYSLTGDPDATQPSGAVRQKAEQPNPPALDGSVVALSGTGSVLIPLAEVWVASNTTGVESADIADRRHAVDRDLGDVSSESLTVGADAAITSFTGDNLDIANGTLNATDTDTDTHLDVTDDGSAVASDVATLDAGTNIDASASSGTVTLDSIDTDTHIDVQDDGSAVASDIQILNFASNVSAAASNGTVTVDSTDTDTHLDVTDDGSPVASDVATLDFASNITASASSGTVTVDAAGGSSGGGTKTTLYMSEYGTDDAAFDNAIEAANPHDTIVFDQDVTLGNSHRIVKPLTIKATDGDITYTNTSNNNAAILFEGGGLGTPTTTQEALDIGSRVITVADASVFSAGDYVLLLDGDYSFNINAKAQFQRIESSNGTDQITLDGGAAYDFPSGINVYPVDLLEGPRMIDLEVRGGNRQLQFHWCARPEFRNCHIEDYLEVSLYALDCWKPRWYDCEARNPKGKGSGEGEPVAAYRCSDGYMESVRVENCRRGIDFAWGAHDFTIIDPIIRGVDLVGIGIHQDDVGGHFAIQGGSVVCDPNAFSGHCIAFSNTASVSVEGTFLAPYETGVIASGETRLSNLMIEPVTTGGGDPGIAGVHVTGSNVQASNIRINDTDGELQFPIYIESNGTPVRFIDLDFNITSPSNNMCYLDARDGADVIEFVNLSGNLRCQNAADTPMYFRADAGYMQDITSSVTIRNGADQGVRLYCDTGTMTELNFHDCFMQTGSAAIYSDGPGPFGNVQINDCRFDTGSTSLSFNDATEKLIITSNILNGSIDSTGVTGSKAIANNI